MCERETFQGAFRCPRSPSEQPFQHCPYHRAPGAPGPLRAEEFPGSQGCPLPDRSGPHASLRPSSPSSPSSGAWGHTHGPEHPALRHPEVQPPGTNQGQRAAVPQAGSLRTDGPRLAHAQGSRPAACKSVLKRPAGALLWGAFQGGSQAAQDSTPTGPNSGSERQKTDGSPVWVTSMVTEKT